MQFFNSPHKAAVKFNKFNKLLIHSLGFVQMRQKIHKNNKNRNAIAIQNAIHLHKG